MNQFYTLVFLFISSNISFAQVETFFVYPNSIDVEYSISEDSIPISFNSGFQEGKLVLFLGGTGTSSALSYSGLRLHSAGLGFDFINLGYPNDVATVSLKDSNDSLAYNNYRLEICFGTPISEAVSVDSLNSITTRTLKLLQFLSTNNLSHNWGQYLTTNNEVDWSKIIVAGHSQGSGHAAYIAKHFVLDRVLMFSGPNDFSEKFLRPADWLFEQGITPVSRHFAYLSLNDEVVSFSNQFENLSALGLLTNGDSTYVDNKVPPYNGSHLLYTTQSLGIVPIDHSAPVRFSLINADVWSYMLSSPIISNVSQSTERLDFTAFPNPTDGLLFIEGDDELRGKEYILHSALSSKTLSGTIGDHLECLNLTHMPSGIYYLIIENQSITIYKE